MKILIDCRHLFRNHLPEEYCLYLMGVLAALKMEKPQVEFYFLADKFPMVKIPAGTTAENIIQVKSLPSSEIWSERQLSTSIKKIKPDILIMTGGIAADNAKTVQLVWIPAARNINKKNKYSNRIAKKIPETIGHASVIFTDSELYKKKLLDQYPFSHDKIIVIPPAVNENCCKIPWEEKEHTKKKYTKGKEYFFIRAKNFSDPDLIDLLKAFSQFKKKQHSNMQCIITGEKENKEFLKKMESFKYRDDVSVFAGLTEIELRKICGAAYAYVQVTEDANDLLCAFGMCIPVVCNKSEYLEEIAGEAALYAQFTEPESTAHHLISIYKNENLRNELIQRGVMRATQLSIQSQQIELWKAIEFALDNKNKQL